MSTSLSPTPQRACRDHLTRSNLSLSHQYGPCSGEFGSRLLHRDYNADCWHMLSFFRTTHGFPTALSIFASLQHHIAQRVSRPLITGNLSSAAPTRSECRRTFWATGPSGCVGFGYTSSLAESYLSGQTLCAPVDGNSLHSPIPLLAPAPNYPKLISCSSLAMHRTTRLSVAFIRWQAARHISSTQH